MRIVFPINISGSAALKRGQSLLPRISTDFHGFSIPICDCTAKTFFTAKTATPALAGGARENAKKN